MSRPHPLVAMLTTHDPAIELAALLIAHDADLSVDIEKWLSHLDALAAPLASGGISELPPRDAALAISSYLFEEHGFRGNVEDYYDPRNSYLDHVLRRKRGIPITLAIVMMAVGRRARVQIDGIGFPGHFLVRVGGESGVFIDPFHSGRLLSPDHLVELARHGLGSTATVLPEYLAPVDARQMTIRMLHNLKHVHRRMTDHARAMVACDRLVELTENVEHRRDRGLHALALGSFATAVDDLEHYLKSAPDAEDAEVIENTLKKVRSAVGMNLQ